MKYAAVVAYLRRLSQRCHCAMWPPAVRFIIFQSNALLRGLYKIFGKQWNCAVSYAELYLLFAWTSSRALFRIWEYACTRTVSDDTTASSSCGSWRRQQRPWRLRIDAQRKHTLYCVFRAFYEVQPALCLYTLNMAGPFYRGAFKNLEVKWRTSRF